MPEVQGNYGSQSTAVKNVENGEMSPERVDANWQTGRYKEPAFTQKIEQLVSAYIMAVFRELDLKFTRAPRRGMSFRISQTSLMMAVLSISSELAACWSS